MTGPSLASSRLADMKEMYRNKHGAGHPQEDGISLGQIIFCWKKTVTTKQVEILSFSQAPNQSFSNSLLSGYSKWSSQPVGSSTQVEGSRSWVPSLCGLEAVPWFAAGLYPNCGHCPGSPGSSVLHPSVPITGNGNPAGSTEIMHASVCEWRHVQFSYHSRGRSS